MLIPKSWRVTWVETHSFMVPGDDEEEACEAIKTLLHNDGLTYEDYEVKSVVEE